MHADVIYHVLLQDLHQSAPMLEMAALQRDIGQLAVVHLPQYILVDKASREVKIDYKSHTITMPLVSLTRRFTVCAMPGHPYL
jgi:hypothetical protein